MLKVVDAIIVIVCVDVIKDVHYNYVEVNDGDLVDEEDLLVRLLND